MAVLVRTTPAATAKGNSQIKVSPGKAPTPLPTAHKVVQGVQPTPVKAPPKIPVGQPDRPTPKPAPKPSVKAPPVQPKAPVVQTPIESNLEDAGQGQGEGEGEGEASAEDSVEGQEVDQTGEVVATKSKKPRVGLTEEEVKAAIEGQLEPREVKGSAEQSALTETDEHGRAKGRPVGISTGLPILGAWAYVFQENEKNPDDAKLTDEQITIWMTEEFPGRDTPAFKRPNGVRDYYNRGGCTKNIIPKIQSQRYNADGTIFVKPPRANPFQKKGTPTTGAPAALVAEAESEVEVEAQAEAGQGEGQSEGQEEVQPSPTPTPKAPTRVVKGPTHAEGSLVSASNASPVTKGKPRMLKK